MWLLSCGELQTWSPDQILCRLKVNWPINVLNEVSEVILVVTSQITVFKTTFIILSYILDIYFVFTHILVTP